MVAFSARQRALSLVPVAALSAAATVGLAGAGQGPAVGPAPVTATAVAAPTASLVLVSNPASATRAGLAARISGGAAAIPAQALAAYQRAATVINASDVGCGLGWDLLAGLGEVESDHGRAVPTGGPLVADTDGGEYDGDAAHDRGVGPFQLLPATWSSVKVDGDGDGRRDPRDLVDAALAAAVYLCSGSENLTTVDGRRAALLRYNPSPGYAAEVLGWATVYGAPAPVTSTSWAFAAAMVGPDRTPKPRARATREPAAPAAPTVRPTPSTPVAGPTKPAPSPTPTPVPPVSRPDPVRQVLTVAGTAVLCTLDGLTALLNPAGPRHCAADRPHRTP